MDNFIFFICFLIDALQIGFVFFFYKKYWKKTEPENILLIKLFMYINLYKLISNGIIVDILRIISGGNENKEFGVSSSEILQVVLFEFISNFIYFSAFTIFLVLLNKKKRKYYVSLQQQIYILASISIITVFNLLFPNLVAPKFWLFQDAIFSLGPICSVIILFMGIKYKKINLVFIGIIPLVVIILLVLISGLRGAIVGIVVVFIIFLLIEFEFRKIRKFLLIGIIPVIMVYQITQKLNSIKYAFAVAASNKTFDFNSFTGYVEFAISFFTNDSSVKIIERDSKPFYKELEFRYGAPSIFSVGFIRMADRGEYAYFRPMMNSFYSYLPRQIFSDNKPFPGSSDGTEKSMGMYKSITEITGYDVSMTDFYVGSHFYWELGWFGLIFLSIIPALYNVLMIQFCKHWSYIGGALLLLSFKPFWLMSKLWISEIITMIPTVILPSILLIFIIHKTISFFRFLSVNKLDATPVK
jgi:hypothetical protein